ncbi:MAG: hypothetical protein ABSC29_04040 [Minisyncoccia bacterium]|jgi:hypothetical protein
MKKMSKKTKRMATEIGAGVLTAAALAAAGAYLLSDKKRRAKAKAWAVKARREVAKNVKTARRMGEAEYKRVVERATKRYGSLHKVNVAEVMRTARDLKAEWQRMKKDARIIAKMMPKRKPARRAKKRTTKKRK